MNLGTELKPYDNIFVNEIKVTTINGVSVGDLLTDVSNIDNKIDEAPKDGKIYGRKDGNWQEIVISSEVDLSNYYTKTETNTLLDTKLDKLNTPDGILYGLKDNVFTEIPAGIEEAPEDDKLYGRKNKTWAEIINSGSEIAPIKVFTITGDTTTTTYTFTHTFNSMKLDFNIYDINNNETSMDFKYIDNNTVEVSCAVPLGTGNNYTLVLTSVIGADTGGIDLSNYYNKIETNEKILESKLSNLTYSNSDRILSATVGLEQISTILPQANNQYDGLMTSGDYNTLLNLADRVASIEEAGLWRGTYHNYSDLIAAYPGLDVSTTSWLSGDYIDIIENELDDFTNHVKNNPSIYIVEEDKTDPNNIIKTLVFKMDTDDKIVIQQANESTLGVVKGVSDSPDMNSGKVFVNLDGTMDVVGWDKLNEKVSNAQSSTSSIDIESIKFNLTGPYIANTPIEIISTNSIETNKLQLHLNGVYTDQFTVVDSTHISLNDNINDTNIVLILDIFSTKNKITFSSVDLTEGVSTLATGEIYIVVE